MPAQGNAPTHNDPGVQPERTDLAWGRTTLSMVAAAAIFLRWLPHHGWFASTLVAAAVVTALAINLTRKRRFNRAVHGIQGEGWPRISHRQLRWPPWSSFSPHWEFTQ
jgi:hypothetical protein